MFNSGNSKLFSDFVSYMFSTSVGNTNKTKEMQYVVNIKETPLAWINYLLPTNT
jgi:hypothetical protein